MSVRTFVHIKLTPKVCIYYLNKISYAWLPEMIVMFKFSLLQLIKDQSRTFFIMILQNSIVSDFRYCDSVLLKHYHFCDKGDDKQQRVCWKAAEAGTVVTRQRG